VYACGGDNGNIEASGREKHRPGIQFAGGT